VGYLKWADVADCRGLSRKGVVVRVRLTLLTLISLLVASACAGSSSPATSTATASAPTTTAVPAPTNSPAGTTATTASSSTTTTALPVHGCPDPQTDPPREGFQGSEVDHIGVLVEWREQVVDLGGGLATIQVGEGAGGTYGAQILDVLWEAPQPLDPAINRVHTFPGDSLVPGLLLALLSNDGNVWLAVPIDDDGCALPGSDLGQIDLTPALALIATSWDSLLAWPELHRCLRNSPPTRPERHDQMLAMILDEIGDIRAEQVRLAGIRRRADFLSTSTRSNGYDLELQLASGIAEADLVYRPQGQLTLAIPSLDGQEMLQLFFFEGDPPEFLAWMDARRRVAVEMNLPLPGNTVIAYVMPYSALGDYDPSCPEAFADLEPYAVIPAEEFLPPNTAVNLDAWRP
jgi:hypothetical protein